MTLPTSYLTSTKNLPIIFEAINSAQAPKKFTTRFLEQLGFKSTADRLIIGVLKSLGFLSQDTAAPTDRYYRFLDQTQSASVLAEAISDAYADLFQVNKNAQNMSRTEVINKLKTLTQGQYSESVTAKMAQTFASLCKLADFKAKPPIAPVEALIEQEVDVEEELDQEVSGEGRVALGGLHYNIQIILPESRDPKVYDVLFRSLKKHLFP